jgi:DNA-binding transcriptional MerR regulator
LRIGEVARLVGVTTKTGRHYEKVGLLGEPERSEAGFRLYTADDLLRLQRCNASGTCSRSASPSTV